MFVAQNNEPKPGQTSNCIARRGRTFSLQDDTHGESASSLHAPRLGLRWGFEPVSREAPIIDLTPSYLWPRGVLTPVAETRVDPDWSRKTPQCLLI